MNIVIFGAPGSGKGTQSELMIKKHGLHHISTGEVLRKEIAAETELGKIADSYISKGQLVPDELIIDILDNLLSDNIIQKGIILDGFPRTIPQAEALVHMLNKRETGITAVIGLEVHEEELVERLLKRGEVSGRSDDNKETIKKRIQVYHKDTEPLMDFYKKAELYFSIEGSKTIDSIADQINAVLMQITEQK